MDFTMDTETPPQDHTPSVDAGQKPMPAIAKVGIGCGILTIVGVIVIALLVGLCTRKAGELIKDFSENPERAAAEMLVKMNPELDLVNTDEEQGTITFRDKSSNKETTVSWSELSDGKLTISDSEGNQTTFGAGGMESVPAWVPRLPATTQVASSFQTVDNGKIAGSYLAGTTMSTAAIEAFLAERAEAMEMESVLDSRQASGAQEMRMIGYKGSDRGFSATIIRDGNGDAQVNFIYEEKSSD